MKNADVMQDAKSTNCFHIPSTCSALRNGFGRVVLVSIVAGIVANILAYLADATVLAAQGAGRDEDARYD